MSLEQFSDNRQEYLLKYDVNDVCAQVLSVEAVKDLDAELPSDTHLVFYRIPDGTAEWIDAVRSHRKINIFDAYHDAGMTVTKILNGFGKVKPKLYRDNANVEALK